MLKYNSAGWARSHRQLLTWLLLLLPPVLRDRWVFSGPFLMMWVKYGSPSWINSYLWSDHFSPCVIVSGGYREVSCVQSPQGCSRVRRKTKRTRVQRLIKSKRKSCPFRKANPSAPSSLGWHLSLRVWGGSDGMWLECFGNSLRIWSGNLSLGPYYPIR